MELFQVTRTLEWFSLGLLGPFTKTTAGLQLVLAIFESYKNIAWVVPLRRITKYLVGIAWFYHWPFKYGVTQTGFWNNGFKFTSKQFHGMCQIMGIDNLYTSTYHPRTYGKITLQVYNCVLLTMLRCIPPAWLIQVHFRTDLRVQYVVETKNWNDYLQTSTVTTVIGILNAQIKLIQGQLYPGLTT